MDVVVRWWRLGEEGAVVAPVIFAGPPGCGSRRRACRVFPGARGIQGDRDTDMLGQVERDERWRTRTEGRVASS